MVNTKIQETFLTGIYLLVNKNQHYRTVLQEQSCIVTSSAATNHHTIWHASAYTDKRQFIYVFFLLYPYKHRKTHLQNSQLGLEW